MNEDRPHVIALDTFDDRTQSIFCRGCRERITDIGGLCIPKNPEPVSGWLMPGLLPESLAKESE